MEIESSKSLIKIGFRAALIGLEADLTGSKAVSRRTNIDFTNLTALITGSRAAFVGLGINFTNLITLVTGSRAVLTGLGTVLTGLGIGLIIITQILGAEYKDSSNPVNK